MQAKGKTNNLDVRGLLYLGGLPSNYKAKNIGNVRVISQLSMMQS